MADLSVYDELCEAIKRIDAMGEIQARNQLIKLHAINRTQGFEIASALELFRTLAEKLDKIRSSR